MIKQPLLVRRIEQKDNHHFCIEWSDGKAQKFRLSDLQRSCCCAGCVDEMTGQKLLDPKAVPDTLGAVKVASVGQYALKVVFTSGCSNGIYTFDMLRAIGKEILP